MTVYAPENLLRGRANMRPLQLALKSSCRTGGSVVGCRGEVAGACTRGDSSAAEAMKAAQIGSVGTLSRARNSRATCT